MKTKNKENKKWVMEKLNLNDLNEMDIQKLLQIEPSLIRYIDLNSLTDAETIAYCVGKKPKKLKEVKTFSGAVLKCALYSDDISLRELIDYMSMGQIGDNANVLNNEIRKFMLHQYDTISEGCKIKSVTRCKIDYLITNYSKSCRYDFTFEKVKECNCKYISRDFAKFIIENADDKFTVSLALKDALTLNDYKDLGIL